MQLTFLSEEVGEHDQEGNRLSCACSNARTLDTEVAGGVMHNIGQIIAAIIFLGSFAVAYYLPILLISGSIAGVVVGVASALLIKKVDLEKITKKTSRRR